MKKQKNQSAKTESKWSFLSISRTQAFVRGLVASALILPMWVPAGNKPVRTVLSQADAANYIQGFKVELEGESTAKIVGQVFTDCLTTGSGKGKRSQITIEAQEHDGKQGFTVLDEGYRECVDKKHKKEACWTNPSSCSKIESAVLSLNSGSSGTIDIHLFEKGDGTSPKAVKLHSQETQAHRDSRTETLRVEEVTRAEQAQAREKKKAAEALDKQFESCRGSMSEIETARDAVGLIATRDGLESDKIDEMLAELDEAELKLFEKKLRKAKDQDDLDDLEDELEEFADDKCDARDDLADQIEDNEDTDEDELEMAEERADRQVGEIAELFRRVAVSRVEIGREQAEDSKKDGKVDPLKENRLAAKTIARAAKIDCLPRETKQELSRMQRDLTVDRCLETAKLGSMYSFDLQMCQQNVMNGLNHDVQRYCSGPAANGMECANARRAQVMLGQQIPALYNQTVQQEQKQWQAFQQSFLSPTAPASQTPRMPLFPSSSGDLYWGS